MLQATLAGRYQIERELGRGGMATVYLARDLRHDRPVALKVLRQDVSGVLGADRFAREISIAAKLNHTHVLPLYDSGTIDTPGGRAVPFYIMPYVTGESLRQRLDAEPQLPVEEAVAIARQVAEALDHAHGQGIIHRDIKPENILLNNGNALVADFGIARALDAAAGPRLTETGLALGTPAYMSPEQGTAGRLDARTDIYALGCVLYEMLAGQPPFTGPNAQAVMARHAVDPVPSIRTVRSTVGPALARVVNRALAKVPADRYPTARAFATALTDPEASTTHETVTRLTPVHGTSRRRRVLLGGSAVAVSAAALALVWATKARSSNATPPTVDPAVVAVAPFRVASADSSLAFLREGMVDLLATKLAGTAVLQPADPRTSLGAWRRAAGGGDLTESAALTAAAGLGAGRLVQGEVVGSGRRLTLSAVLVDVPGGRVGARAAVEGSADSLTPMVDQLSARLLSLAAGEPEERLGALTAVPRPALVAYLDGQVLLRNNDAYVSYERFKTALAADSGFALAALGAVRANLEGEYDRNSAEAQLAWKLRDRLSPRDRAKLEWLLGPNYPEPKNPQTDLGLAEGLTHMAPDDPEAWYFYGTALSGSGVRLSMSEALPRTKTAYGRALKLDPGAKRYLLPYLHMAAVLRDTGAVREGMPTLLAVDSVSPASVSTQWEAAAFFGDTVAARRAALKDSMVTTRANGWTQNGLWSVMSAFVHEGLGSSDLDLLLRQSLANAPTERQQGNLLQLQYNAAVVRGRAGALPMPDFWLGAGRNASRVVQALFAGGDSAAAVEPAAALERQVGVPLGGDCCLDRFVAGEYALATGRLLVARRALADLERAGVRHSDTAVVGPVAQAYAIILAAHLAASDRPPRAAERLRSLDSMLTDPTVESTWIPVLGNLISARLHEDRDEYREALTAIRRRDRNELQPIYVTYHREEGRIAAEAGDTAGAVTAYQRYLRIRADAEPRLQPEVQQVRQELAALVGEHTRR